MVTKICRKCNESKNYTEFIRKDNSLGKFCKSCKIISKNKQTKEYFREYRAYKRKTDKLYNLTDRVRSLIYNGLKKKGFSKKSRTFEILGCSYEFFIEYIENQFKDGMTWNNIHLDHIKPISLATTEKEVIELNHYSNFQPLFIIDNLKKGNTYIVCSNE